MLYAYSMLSSMATTLILGILFIFLSKQSGKVYMKQWGICWSVYSLVFLLDFFNLQTGENFPGYLSIRQIFLLVASWFFLSATCRFFQVKVMPVANIAFTALLIATLFTIYFENLYEFILIPNILITASLLIGSGCMFISYSWTQNLPEKIAASFLIILWAFFINHFGFTIMHVRLAIVTYFVGIAIVTVLMLLLLIIHFKKSHFLDNKQASRFRLLVENSSDCMFLFSYRSRSFEYVSPEINRAIGVSAEQLYAYPERFFDHLETSKKQRNSLSIFSVPVKSPGNVTFSLVRRGQVVLWSEMHYIPIFDDMGNPTSVEGIIRDITENKLAEEKVRDTEKAKEDFVENITHEIRTPVTLIQGYAESIVDEVIPAESSKAYLNLILSKAVLLNSLLDDLKQVSHFTSQELEYKFFETPVQKYTDNIIEQCQYHVEQSLRTFTSCSNIPENIIFIIDPSRIMQVVSNLINNAIKQTPVGNTISVQVNLEPTADDVPLNDNLDNTLPDGMVTFKVIDSGKGIAEDDLPHLFERGFKGRNSTDNVQKNSSGLGLFIAKQIMNQHSGQISAENNSTGGACFSIYLPYYNE